MIIYAVVFCVMGACRLDPYGQTFRTLHDCEHYRAEFTRVIPESRPGHPTYRCFRETVPAWRPAE